MSVVTLGTDPEAFVITRNRKFLGDHGIPADLVGYALPAYYAYGGVIDHEVPLTYGVGVQDGLAVEFTVAPTDDPQELVRRMFTNLGDLGAFVHDTCGGWLNADPCMHVHPLYVDRLSPEYGKRCSLQIFGCAPDFTVYSMDQKQRPDPKDVAYRSSGGHMHFGVDPRITGDDYAPRFITAALDRIIGTASVFLCQSAHAYQRKSLYGDAGTVRVSEGRIEYRVPPAQFLLADETVTHAAFTVGQAVVEYVQNIFLNAPDVSHACADCRKLLGEYAYILAVARAINAHDVGDTRSTYRRFVETMPAELRERGGDAFTQLLMARPLKKVLVAPTSSEGKS